MKKTKKILILLLTCILLTACGSKTGLKNANLKKTTTYSIQGLKFHLFTPNQMYHQIFTISLILKMLVTTKQFVPYQ